jgi:tetratricopeptide (TPR) repeat protein
VAVVGTSGSGKSSLIRSGLIPSLQGGFMAGAGSGWRIATMRPGDDPIGNLARALDAPDVLGVEGELATTNRILVEATLRRSGVGLVEAVRQARMPADENVLVLVDQFEELFRFRRNRHLHDSRDEAMAFVRLLLEAAAQQQAPIFIVLTMRSDFIGDCMDFRGLPDAVNAGLYLVGRMTRDGMRAAISGPVAVAGGAVTPRLVNRILNDIGDDHDQLPVVQHALMRMWEFWAAANDGDPIDIDDYEAVGTTAHALSLHAEEAYLDCEGVGKAGVIERVFKALTDTFADARGIRRPTSVAELAAITGAPESDIVQVVDFFRREGRSFLTPRPRVPLSSSTIVDVAHESLMRCWDRLITWAEEEREAAAFYARLSQAAAWHAAGEAGLWRNPELELAQVWQQETAPTGAWAARYDARFDQTMAFLDTSTRAWNDAIAAEERTRRQTLRRTQLVAAVLATMLVAAVALAVVARRESRRAEANLQLARTAVDESLSSADRSIARVGADSPAVEELRRDLLSKAERFYQAFMYQAPRSEQSRSDLAMAHMRLGQIHRLVARPGDAEREYKAAITGLDSLVADFPKPEYRSALGSCYNWLGEVLRVQPARIADAEQAYDRALAIQRPLADETGQLTQYRQELARTLYNRGILLSGLSGRAPEAEGDFRQAVAILEPLSASDTQAAQELARAYNNLGSLMSFEGGSLDEVQRLWEQAIAIDERLLSESSDNREYKFELATYAGNLASLLDERGNRAEAERRSAQAVRLLDEISRVAPSLAVARADAHGLRGTILAGIDGARAEREFSAAIDQFASMAEDPAVRRSPEFRLRLGDLLLNLASLAGAVPGGDGATRLLPRALSTYLDLVASMIDTSSTADARAALDRIAGALTTVREPDRARLTARVRELNARLETAGARP